MSIEKRQQIIDNNTGELLSDKTNVIDIHKMPDEPAYIKFYINDLSGLQGLTAGETQILLYVAACADYKGMIALPTGIKSRIAKHIGCSDGAVNNAVNLFCKKRILNKEGGGLYELNPDYFARGKWREIRERRKAFYTKITYSPDGERTVKTDVVD
jgi:Firmicute plasmid replication protein (RepL)